MIGSGTLAGSPKRALARRRRLPRRRGGVRGAAPPPRRSAASRGGRRHGLRRDRPGAPAARERRARPHDRARRARGSPDVPAATTVLAIDDAGRGRAAARSSRRSAPAAIAASSRRRARTSSPRSLAAGLVDELFLTVSPLLLGRGPRAAPGPRRRATRRRRRRSGSKASGATRRTCSCATAVCLNEKRPGSVAGARRIPSE